MYRYLQLGDDPGYCETHFDCEHAGEICVDRQCVWSPYLDPTLGQGVTLGQPCASSLDCSHKEGERYREICFLNVCMRSKDKLRVGTPCYSDADCLPILGCVQGSCTVPSSTTPAYFVEPDQPQSPPPGPAPTGPAPTGPAPLGSSTPLPAPSPSGAAQPVVAGVGVDDTTIMYIVGAAAAVGFVAFLYGRAT